jgi:hypothetical protein
MIALERHRTEGDLYCGVLVICSLIAASMTAILVARLVVQWRGRGPPAP